MLKHIDEFELNGIGWHFFITDSKGDKVIIEFLGKKAKVYSGTDAIYPLLCNTAYSSELKHISTFKGFGGDSAID